MSPYLLVLLVAISLGAAGQVLLKAGLGSLPSNATIADTLLSIFRSGYVFMGFACYGLSSLVYLVALRKLELSYAYPMVALSYVIVVVLSWWLFHERIPPLRIGALAVILLGVVLLAMSSGSQDRSDTGGAEGAEEAHMVHEAP